MKKLIFTILIIVLIAFVVHWTGVPIGSYVDIFLDKVFAWTNGIIPRLTELIPKFGAWVKQSVQSITN